MSKPSKEKNMNDDICKFGIYFDKWTPSQQLFGIGLVWEKRERYVHLNLFNFELAIGVTRR